MRHANTWKLVGTRAIVRAPIGLLLVMGARGLAAQSDSTLRGDRLSTDVTINVHAGPADSVSTTYTVHNAASSRQVLGMFVVRMPFADAGRFLATSSQGWYARSGLVQDSMAASWIPLAPTYQLAPGGASARFTVTAVGILGIVAYRAQGDFDLPDADEADEVDPIRAPPFWTNSFAGVTIGPVPAPGIGTPTSALLDDLDRMTSQSCDLGWIAPAGVCTSLSAKLTMPEGRAWDPKPFLAELDAQRGTHVSEEAYWLLKIDAEYAASH